MICRKEEMESISFSCQKAIISIDENGILLLSIPLSISQVSSFEKNGKNILVVDKQQIFPYQGSHGFLLFRIDNTNQNYIVTCNINPEFSTRQERQYVRFSLELESLMSVELTPSKYHNISEMTLILTNVSKSTIQSQTQLQQPQLQLSNKFQSMLPNKNNTRQKPREQIVSQELNKKITDMTDRLLQQPVNIKNRPNPPQFNDGIPYTPRVDANSQPFSIPKPPSSIQEGDALASSKTLLNSLSSIPGMKNIIDNAMKKTQDISNNQYQSLIDQTINKVKTNRSAPLF